MRRISLSIGLVLLAAIPARAQSVQDFGFGAGFSLHPKTDVSPQLSATVVLGIRGHDIELAAGSTSADAFFSASRIWTRSFTSFGGGFAAYNDMNGTKPGLAVSGALALPIAPRSAAALQLTARAIAVSGSTNISLGAGIRLAPLRGGLILGENVPKPQVRADRARSWEVMVAQIMLLHDGSSSITDVQVSHTSLAIQVDSSARAMSDVARIARILAASSEYIQIIINSRQFVDVGTAVTAGGFPAERITMGDSTGPTTIQVLRAPRGTSGRFEQR